MDMVRGVAKATQELTEMELDDRVEQLEHETKILKNEIKTVLLDLRESYLARENPFDLDSVAVIAQPSSLDQAPEETASGDGADNELAEMPTDESDDCNKPEISAEEIAIEEVKMARRPEVQAESKLHRSRETSSEGTGLAMVAALIRWTTDSAKQLGQEGARAVVEISELMGNMPPDVKSILFKLISLTPSEYSGKATTSAYLPSLLKLTNLLGKCDKTEANLISVLLEQKENG
jgi:uncharacterized protein (UPF0335 family)